MHGVAGGKYILALQYLLAVREC